MNNLNICLAEATFEQIVCELKLRADVFIIGAMYNDCNDWTIQSSGRQIELLGLVELIKHRANLKKADLINLLIDEDEEEGEI